MKFEEGEESDWLNDEDSSNISDSDKEKEKENEQDKKQDEDYQDRRDYVTRSGRISRQPKRYGFNEQLLYTICLLSQFTEKGGCCVL